MEIEALINLKKTYLTFLNPEIFPELKGEVVAVRVDDELIPLVKILGLPSDGKAFRIRSGFMCYDKKNHLLVFARNKTDLPKVAIEKKQKC